MTLAELLIIIAVIGVLAAIAIPQISGVRKGAGEGLHADTVALANRAVRHYEQAAEEIAVEAAGGTTEDEIEVLDKVMERDPELRGSPYLDAQFPRDPGSGEETYRMIWNGGAFELVLPGEAGTGIVLGPE